MVPESAATPSEVDAAAMDFAAADATEDAAAARFALVKRVLEFEGEQHRPGAAKARAIRAEFGWSATRYHQVLNGMLDSPDALRHDPMLVRRLLRVRDSERRASAR